MFFNKQNKEIASIHVLINRIEHRCELMDAQIRAHSKIMTQLVQDTKTLKNVEGYGFKKTGEPRQKPGRKPLKGTK